MKTMKLVAGLLLVAACGSETTNNTTIIVSPEGGSGVDDGGAAIAPDGGVKSDGPADAGFADGSPDGSVASPFVGEPSYLDGAAPQNAKGVAQHSVIPGASATLDPSGSNCSATGVCHAVGGNQPFLFSGTAYASTNNPALPGTEVRVVGADGAPIGMAYTDADGNFWSVSGTWKAPAYVGVRTSARTRVMVGSLDVAGGSCNAANCHLGGINPMIP